jgi:hypothetical protein
MDLDILVFWVLSFFVSADLGQYASKSIENATERTVKNSDAGSFQRSTSLISRLICASSACLPVSPLSDCSQL